MEAFGSSSGLYLCCSCLPLAWQHHVGHLPSNWQVGLVLPGLRRAILTAPLRDRGEEVR